MKKLLLSSIIMLGACGIASAQSDSKAAKQKQVAAAATTAAPTPQKAAIMPASDAAVAAPAASDVDANAAAPATTQRVIKTPADKAQAVTVDAAGVVVPSNDAARKEAKMAAAKAANAPTGKQN